MWRLLQALCVRSLLAAAAIWAACMLKDFGQLGWLSTWRQTLVTFVFCQVHQRSRASDIQPASKKRATPAAPVLRTSDLAAALQEVSLSLL